MAKYILVIQMISFQIQRGRIFGILNVDPIFPYQVLNKNCKLQFVCCENRITGSDCVKLLFYLLCYP